MLNDHEENYEGGTAPLTKKSMFCALSQNYQHLCEK